MSSLVRFVSGKRSTVLCLCAAISAAASGPAAVAASSPLVEEPVIAVDPATIAGTATIRLNNSSASPLTIALSAGPVRSTTTGQEIGARVRFFELASPDDAVDLLTRAPLDPGKSALYGLEIQNAWEAGEMKAELRNDGNPIGTIRALRTRVPFGVSLVTDEQGGAELVVRQGGEGTLYVENADPLNYTAEWQLAVPGLGTTESRTGLQLAASSTTPITVSLPELWFANEIRGYLYDEAHASFLHLRFRPAGVANVSGLAERVLPVELKLRYQTPLLQNLWSTVVVLVLLGAGGICSLMLSYYLPNKARRARLEEKLDALSDQISRISREVDSALRVQVRLAKQRIGERARSRWAISPELPALLSGGTRDADALAVEVEVLKGIDRALDELAQKERDNQGPPTVLASARASLEEAMRLLRAGADGDAVVKARGLSEGAEQLLADPYTADPELPRKLAERLEELRSDLLPDPADPGKLGSTAVCQDLLARLAGLSRVLNDTDLGDPAKIRERDHQRIDSSVERLFILRHYLRRLEETRNTGVHGIISQHQEELVALLNQHNWDSITKARTLKLQIEEGVFEDQIHALLKKGLDGVEVKCEPPRPRPYQPASLTARLRDRDMDRTAARDRFTCVWHFAHSGSSEKAWEISHYFPAKGEQTVTVSFLAPDGSPVLADDGTPVELPLTVTVVPEKSPLIGQYTRIEITHLSIALGVALLGLVAGARQQLEKLDLVAAVIAVFLVGFGADTIKNLLTRQAGDVE